MRRTVFVVDVEGVELRARRVPGSVVERVEVLPHGRDLVAVPDLVAHAEEDVLDLAADLRQQVQPAAVHGLAGDRDVDAGLGRLLVGEPHERGLAGRDRLLELRADAVQEHAALAVAHAAQRLGELRLAAEVLDARVVELVLRERGVEGAQRFRFRTRSSPPRRDYPRFLLRFAGPTESPGVGGGALANGAARAPGPHKERHRLRQHGYKDSDVSGVRQDRAPLRPVVAERRRGHRVLHRRGDALGRPGARARCRHGAHRRPGRGGGDRGGRRRPLRRDARGRARARRARRGVESTCGRATCAIRRSTACSRSC